MKTTYQIYFLLLIGVILVGCNSDKSINDEQGMYLKVSQRIDSLANEFLSQGNTVGFTIAILKNEDTLYNNGFGFIDTLRENGVNSETIFNLASISKLIGSAIVMKLVEEEVLSLDDSLEKLFPEFPNKDQARKIKLRHLISMTSGLKEYAPEIDSIFLASRIPPSKSDLLNFFSRQKLDFEPGQFYRYSNSGFVLLPFILERATNETYEELIERIINKPSGLNIKLITESQFDPNTSQFFEISNDKVNYRPHWSWLRGDGGMTATAIELAHVPALLMNEKIINSSSFKQMTSLTKLYDDLYSDYGFGVANGNFEGLDLWGHSGADKSFWSMMYYFPEQELTIVTFVNTNNTFYDAKELFIRVALNIFGKETPNYTEAEVTNYDKQTYIGKYLRPGDAQNQIIEITLSEKDNHLYYTYDGKIESGVKMYHLGDDEFWIEKWPTDRMKFVKDKENRILAFKEYYAGYFSQLRKKIK